MKTITIGFSRPKNRLFPIGSWLIRLYEKTPYSHVYIKFYTEKYQRELVYEAVGSGVRFVGSKLWENKAEEIKEFKLEIEDNSYYNLMQYCIDNAGTDYGCMQNIGLFIANLFNLSHNPFKKGMNCSELVANVLERTGYLVLKPKDLITPKDIYLMLTDS